MDEIVRNRLTELTSSGDKYNDWPDKAELVEVKLFSSGKELYEIGFLFGTATARGHGQVRQVCRDQVPRQVSEHLLDTLWNGHVHRGLQTFWWMLVPPKGNAGGGGPHNLYGIIEPKFHWNTGHLELPGLRVEIGCKHEMQGKNLGNCYNESRCQKCGYYFRIDSSD